MVGLSDALLPETNYMVLWFLIPELLETDAELDTRITDLEEGGGGGSGSNGKILQ